MCTAVLWSGASASRGGDRGFEIKNVASQEHLPPQYRFDIPPKATVTVAPVFPHDLRGKGAGSATVNFVVGASGKVVDTNVVDATPPACGLALAAALDRFEFKPALKGGGPTATMLSYQQVFDDGMASDEERAAAALESQHPERIRKANQLDASLRVLTSTPPVFPTALRGNLSHGEAMVEFLVNEAGHVCLPRIVKASAPAFGYAAAQAVSLWTFSRPESGQKPAVVRVRVPFVFDLADSPAPTRKP